MFPTGHARNTTADLKKLLAHKFNLLGKLATDDPAALVKRFDRLEKKSATEIAEINDFELVNRGAFE